MTRNQPLAARPLGHPLATVRRKPRHCLTRGHLALISILIAAGSVACAGPSTALDRAPEEARKIVADLEASEPPPSYTFRYSLISEVFMACLSGVEDIDGVVDARNQIVRLTPHGRDGVVYLVDDLLLIETILMREFGQMTRFVAVRLGSSPDEDTLAPLRDAVGTGLSVLISGGEWPAHPNEIAMSAVSVAATITPIAPTRDGVRGIRFVLDPTAYFDLVAPDVTMSAGSDPPIVDAYVASNGVVQRLVVRKANPADPSVPEPDGDGYAMDFDFDPDINIAVPPDSDIAPILIADLPASPVAIPCQVEP